MDHIGVTASVRPIRAKIAAHTSRDEPNSITHTLHRWLLRPGGSNQHAAAVAIAELASTAQITDPSVLRETTEAAVVIIQESLCDALQRPGSGDARAPTRNAMLAAHSTVRQSRTRISLTLASVRGRRLVLGHVGNTRALLWRSGSIQVLTTDHTEGALRGDSSDVRLAQVLGQASEPIPDVLTLGVTQGDAIVLCNSTVHRRLTEGDFAAVLSSLETPSASARALVEHARRSDPEGELSAVVLRLD